MVKMNPMIDFSKINREITAQAYNVRDDLKAATVSEIQELQKNIAKPWSVMCINLTGELNQGVGRNKTDRRSYVGVEKYFSIYKVDAGLSVHRVDADLPDLQVDVGVIRGIFLENNLVPIFIEQGGDTLGSFDWKETFQIIAANDCRPIFVFGNEGIGIQDDILALRDEFEGSKIVSINQIGVTRSLNVATAAGITLHHFSSAMDWI